VQKGSKVPKVTPARPIANPPPPTKEARGRGARLSGGGGDRSGAGTAEQGKRTKTAIATPEVGGKPPKGKKGFGKYIWWW